MPRLYTRTPLKTRFDAKVDRSGGAGACWPWTGAKFKTGYGAIAKGGDSGAQASHRVAWMLTNGPIPEGLYVCHRCDNRSCCNPDHLFLGTAQQNTDDMMSKGRLSPRRTKLSSDDVRAIRCSADRGCDLAARYGVPESTVCMIRKGRYFKSVA